MSKLTVGLICGGQSAEHAVSLRSAASLWAGLVAAGYAVSLCYIAHDGRWYWVPNPQAFFPSEQQQSPHCHDCVEVAWRFGPTPTLMCCDGSVGQVPMDILFPICHGTAGEDGSLQGLARLAGLPCVGCDVLGSAVNMDKDVCKRLLRDAGVAVMPWRVVTSTQQLNYAQAKALLGEVLFVKAATLGSSVGVYRVTDEASYHDAMVQVFALDQKALVEQAVVGGREFECAVLMQDQVEVTWPSEVVLEHDFYDYDTKYLEAAGMRLVLKADISQELAQQAQAIARQVVKATECTGLARVDLFLTAAGQWVVNEVNTLPGFTSISAYPSMWQHAGLALPQLLQAVVKEALGRFQRYSKLRRVPEVRSSLMNEE